MSVFWASRLHPACVGWDSECICQVRLNPVLALRRMEGPVALVGQSKPQCMLLHKLVSPQAAAYVSHGQPVGEVHTPVCV